MKFTEVRKECSLKMAEWIRRGSLPITPTILPNATVVATVMHIAEVAKADLVGNRTRSGESVCGHSLLITSQEERTR